MPVDVTKQLDKAKKYLERNKIVEAAEAYQSAVNDSPSNQEALQGLGDIYTRLGQPDRAATYYGSLFDRLCEARDENKATALYTRALRGTQQSPERIARYAFLLQKQGRTADAIENYVAASELLLARGKQEPALDCLERVALLEPDSAARQFAAGNLAEQLGRSAVAVRAFLRAAQLTEASGDSETALGLLQRAHGLAPAERSPALLYAQALLLLGNAAEAVGLLESHANAESDATFLNTFSEALMKAGELDRARVGGGGGRLDDDLVHGRSQPVAAQIGIQHGILHELRDLQPGERGQQFIHERRVGGKFFRREMPGVG